jgi:hypothetical protein
MRQIVTTLAALLLVASPALAQKVDRNGVPYREWDVDLGIGFHSLTGADGDVGDEAFEDDNWNPSWVGSLGAGHYWTSHVKTEAGITFLQQYYTASSAQVVLPDGQLATTYASNDISQTQITVAATYQFFENAFAHPYVSTGARVGVLDVDGQVGPYGTIIGNAWRPVTIPVVERHSRHVRVRPYMAIGSKSYFSERVYVRPEMVLGFNSRGMSQFGARLAFGVDF